MCVPATSRSAAALARRVAALADPQLRVTYVRSQLLEMGVDDVADLFLVAAHRAEARKAPYQELLLTLSLALLDPTCEAMRRAVSSAAAARGQWELTLLLGGTASTEAEDETAAAPIPDFGRGRTLTLGERKALARRADRQQIAKVLRDPHPDVIRVLLGNPGLTELDVIRLAARRTVTAAVLEAIFRSPRWVLRYSVRKALVLNPRTPPTIALQLAPHLTTQDARLAAASEELDPDLRRACGRGSGGSVVH